MFTPWVRKIHFVTWGHVPDFLDTNHSKLHVVRHEDFMPKDSLPTFSSHALEMNLHRISGLTEHFVYFNDDTFLLRPLMKTAFFQEGLPCTYGGEVPIELKGSLGVWQYAAVNDLAVVNAHFSKKQAVRKHRGKYVNSIYCWKDNLRTLMLEELFPFYFTGFKNLHAPAAYRKQTFKELWAAEPEILMRTTMHKFRDADSVNQWVALWWQVASGNFAPSNINTHTYWAFEGDLEAICHSVRHQTLDMICLNDPDTDTDFDMVSKRINEAFSTILPQKSTFEK